MSQKFVSLANVRPPTIPWLWENRIAFGAITLVESYHGCFKSTIICDLAARCTTGRPMPLETKPRQPQSVLILNAEDPVATTYSRLQLAGADLSRVILPVENYRPQLPHYLFQLEQIVADGSVGMMVLDPIASFSAKPLTADAATRRLMDRFSAFAQRYGLAVVAIRHWVKSATASPIYRGGGSYSITASARSELIVGINPHDARQRIIAQLKSNLAPLAESVLFEPVGHTDGATINWIGSSPLTAQELMDAVQPKDRPALEEAKRVLYSLLAVGPVPVKEVVLKAADAAVSRMTLRRAKEELGVVSDRYGFGPDGLWLWKLPEQSHPAVEAQRAMELDALTDQLFHGSDSHDADPNKPSGPGDDEPGNAATPVPE